MRLKNILIVVSDIERSKRFYHDLFGLQVIKDFGENVIMSEGLVLQEQKTWEHLVNSDMVIGNAFELFFVDNNFDIFIRLIEDYPEKICLIGEVRTNSWGNRVVQLLDPDGHIIEVAEDVTARKG